MSSTTTFEEWFSAEPFVHITYSPRQTKLTPKDKAMRKQLEAAIQKAMVQFHLESRDAVDDIELHPCPGDCEHCLAA